MMRFLSLAAFAVCLLTVAAQDLMLEEKKATNEEDPLRCFPEKLAEMKELDTAPTFDNIRDKDYSVLVTMVTKIGESIRTVSYIQEVRKVTEKQSGLSKVTTGNKRVQFVFRDEDTVLQVDNESDCQKLADPNTADPYNANKTWVSYDPTQKHWRTVADIFKTFTEQKKFYEANDTRKVSGVPSIHYVSCASSGKKGSELYFEMEVVVASSGQFPYTKKNATEKKIPMQISVKLYSGNVSTPTVKYSAMYELNDLKMEVDLGTHHCERLLAPPMGVYCENLKTDAKKLDEIAKFPDAFTVRYGEGSSRPSEMIYRKPDILSISAVVKKKDKPEIYKRTVYDFAHAMRYCINTELGSCIRVAPMAVNESVGTASSTTTGRIQMKQPFELLTGIADVTTLQFAGQHTMNGLLMDSYVVNTTADGKGVTEILVDPTTKHLIAVNKYDHKLKHTPIQSQWLSGLATIEEGSFPWDDIDILPCLKTCSNKSFLYAKMNQITIDQLLAGGTALAKNRLRVKLAATAGVSPLRVSDFFFRSDVAKETDGKSDGLTVFFLLANRTSATTTPNVTEGQKPQKTLADALTALNATLTKEKLDVKLMVDGEEKSVSVAQKSLQAIPAEFHAGGVAPTPPAPTPAPKKGGGGGLSWLLAIFMLLIGVAIGVGIAFFLWKRNRGIAYQVYE